MKILFIFTEGPHDVAFVKLVLELCLNIKHEQHAKIADFPKPLDSIFLQLMKNHSMGDLSLDMVHKFFLPNYVFRAESFFIMLFNTGGMNNYSKLKSLLSQIIQQIKIEDKSYSFRERDMEFLFTYDVDYRTIDERIEEMSNKLFPITENDAFPDVKDVQESNPNVLLNEDMDSVNFYIWANNGIQGTLEDILLDIYSKSSTELLNASKDFINKNFSENFIFTEEITKQNIATKAEKSKACITIAGQGERPARPLAAIITDNVLSDKQSFISNKNVLDFKKFLCEKINLMDK